MKPIRTHNDLLNLAAANAPTKACAREITEQGATILGGFNPVENLPGWIIQVHNRTGKEWFIGIEVDEARRRYQIIYLDRVPWLHWLGKTTGRNVLIDGDQPRVSSYLRMKERRSCQK